MNRKQQAATAILALVIIGSVALMPVSAEQKNPTRISGVRHAGLVASVPSPAAELPQEQVRDLTYN
jgi:hypothetical protein